MEALENAQVVYAGSWSSTAAYGDSVKDRALRDNNSDWCIDESWFDGITAKPCYLMHSLRVRRGVEVEDGILDEPRSIGVHQAKKRMFAQMSVLLNLLA